MLKRGEHLEPGTVQQDTHIGEREVEKITDLLGFQALPLAQQQHAGLHFRQAGDGLFQALAQLGLGQQGLGRIQLPLTGWRLPVAILGEALGADAAMRRRQVIEQRLAALLLETALGGVGGNGQQPGLQAGALLEGQDPLSMYERLQQEAQAPVQDAAVVAWSAVTGGAGAPEESYVNSA